MILFRSQVMNAPKEYYPVGYEKNFDDNFQTKVDLPPTTFHCGDQKHFPGLYGDVDLGCMVSILVKLLQTVSIWSWEWSKESDRLKKATPLYTYVLKTHGKYFLLRFFRCSMFVR